MPALKCRRDLQAVAPVEFAACNEPDQVKIACTLEAEPWEASRTRFATETRVDATDAGARAKFPRILAETRSRNHLIRLVLLRAVRREAERQFRLGRR